MQSDAFLELMFFVYFFKTDAFGAIAADQKTHIQMSATDVRNQTGQQIHPNPEDLMIHDCR